jgi:hypothetical protein
MLEAVSNLFTSESAQRVPTLQGWCKDDGADFVSMDVSLPNYHTMDEEQYQEWWAHFRGTGFDTEREVYFNPDEYQPVGSSSSQFMAANNAVTTSFYSCGIHKMVPTSES